MYCKNCDKQYTGQAGEYLQQGYMSTKTQDAPSLISVYEDREGHKFNFEKVSESMQSRTMHSKGFREA